MNQNNIYSQFEDFLTRHNLFKPKELMRSIQNLKLLEKVPQDDLNTLLNNNKMNPLWEMLSDIPFATLKSKICDKKELSILIEHSNQWPTSLTDLDWMVLFYKKYQNQKIFLNHICHKNAVNKVEENQYSAKTQNLPWNIIKLKNCTLVTPISETVIKELSTALSLCTYDNRRYIGPFHQKMIVFNNKNQPIAFLTIYPNYNCFAVSGKKNSRIDFEVEKEIKVFLVKEKILLKNAYLIGNQHDFSIVNTKENNFSSYDLEYHLKNDEELIRTMFPNIEEKIRLYNEEKEAREKAEKQREKEALEEGKARVRQILNDPDLLSTIQTNLIKRLDNSNNKWELRGLETLIHDLVNDRPDEHYDAGEADRLFRRMLMMR